MTAHWALGGDCGQQSPGLLVVDHDIGIHRVDGFRGRPLAAVKWVGVQQILVDRESQHAG